MSVCLNDTDEDGNCPACARNPEAPCRVSVPETGARYVKRAVPDAGRVVTVTRAWKADDGHTAVAYEWTDNKPGQSFSACPLIVFLRTYRPEASGASASARDEIFKRLAGAFVTEDRANALIDAYAHELAEKIRVAACEEIDRQGPRTSPSDQKYDKAAGMVKAAKLIDPEVLNSGS